jgi:hypothetical protein
MGAGAPGEARARPILSVPPPAVAGSNVSGGPGYSQTDDGTSAARTVVRFQVKPGILPSYR